MQQTCDVLIIGGGVIGLSALYYLSKHSKLKITLLEKSRIGSGASHQSGGFVRCFHPDHQRIYWAAKSLKYFRNRAKQTGFQEIGARYIPEVTTIEELQEQISYVRSYKEDIEIFQSNGLQQIAPELRTDTRSLVIYEPNAGFADPLKTCIDFAEQSLANGANLLEGAMVTSITREKESINVETEFASYRCRHIVIATGAWIRKTLALLNEPTLVRSKKIQADLFKVEHEDFVNHSLIDQKLDVFTRPFMPGTQLIGTATNCFDIDPDIPIAKDKQQTLFCLENAHTLFNNPPSLKVGGRVGIDGYLPLSKGNIRSASKDKRITISEGWSGSGFQFSPAVGEEISEHVVQLLGNF